MSFFDAVYINFQRGGRGVLSLTVGLVVLLLILSFLRWNSMMPNWTIMENDLQHAPPTGLSKSLTSLLQPPPEDLPGLGRRVSHR